MRKVNLNDQVITESYLLSLYDYEAINEGLLLEGLTVDAIKTSFTKNINKVEEILKSYDIDTNKVKAVGKKISYNLKDAYKKGLSSENVGKSLTKEVVKAFWPLVTPLKKKLLETEDSSFGKKIFLAIVCLILVFFLNTMIMTFATIVTGSPVGGLILTATIVAPLTEEAVKNYFILKGLPWLGTSIVFGFEFIMYVVRIVNMGISLPAAVVMRAVGLVFHFATTFIQKSMIDKATYGSMVDENAAYKAWFVGVMCHCAFNTLALVGGLAAEGAF